MQDSVSNLKSQLLHDELLVQLSQLRSLYQHLLDRNQALQSNDRLTNSELAIDLALRDQLLKSGSDAVSARRNEIMNATIGKELIASRIASECYDSMEILGQTF